MKIDPKSFEGFSRVLTGVVVPRPIALVSTKSTDGIVNLAPFSFFNAVAYDPPTVVFSSSRRVGEKREKVKDTLANIEATGEFVDVGSAGVVTTWAWISEPRRFHPLDKPFAFALIKLDGADTALLHAVDVARDSMKTGMRVVAKWREQREGRIADIECFVAEDAT